MPLEPSLLALELSLRQRLCVELWELFGRQPAYQRETIMVRPILSRTPDQRELVTTVFFNGAQSPEFSFEAPGPVCGGTGLFLGAAGIALPIQQEKHQPAPGVDQLMLTCVELQIAPLHTLGVGTRRFRFHADGCGNALGLHAVSDLLSVGHLLTAHRLLSGVAAGRAPQS